MFENRAQDVRVLLAGKGDERAITGSEIEFGKKGSRIWVAVLESAWMWNSIDVTPAQAKKIIPLKWKMPFVAQWRVDFTRKEGLTDSWDMLLMDKDGKGFIKPTWLAQDGKIREATRTATGEVDRDAYRPGGPASDRLGPDRLRARLSTLPERGKARASTSSRGLTSRGIPICTFSSTKLVRPRDSISFPRRSPIAASGKTTSTCTV